jgi:hypothetical protein
LRAYIASIPYDVKEGRTEKDYQYMFYIIVSLMGWSVRAEEKHAAGRADVVIELPNAVYVFEFKLSGAGTAEDALKQIDDRGYLIPYTANNKKLFKIGVEFDEEKRTIGRWIVKETENSWNITG